MGYLPLPSTLAEFWVLRLVGVWTGKMGKFRVRSHSRAKESHCNLGFVTGLLILTFFRLYKGRRFRRDFTRFLAQIRVSGLIVGC